MASMQKDLGRGLEQHRPSERSMRVKSSKLAPSHAKPTDTYGY